jgi:hypothetical protein
VHLDCQTIAANWKQESRMSDFHKNIFYFYRGPKQKRQNLEQQLEDNTTKALINVLENCNRKVVNAFLEHINIKLSKSDQIQFDLQNPTIGIEKIFNKNQKILLAIVENDLPKNKSILEELNELRIFPKGDSRPDGWIYGQDFVVLIESKVGESPLEPKQMEKHWKKLSFDGIDSPEWRLKRWEDVHNFFSKCLPELAGKDEWLVKQFKQYLEVTGMAGFFGFEKSIFEFFVQEEKDTHTKEWIRKAMIGMAEKLLNCDDGLKKLDSFYSDSHLGKFNKDDSHFWVAFGPKNKYGDSAHLTMSIHENGIDVFVNVENQLAMKSLKTRIREDRAELRENISNVPLPFLVQIEKRKEVRIHVWHSYIIAQINALTVDKVPYGLKDPQSSSFDYAFKLINEIDYPYLTVRKRIDRQKVIKTSKGGGEDLINEILEIMKSLNPLVQFINK